MDKKINGHLSPDTTLNHEEEKIHICPDCHQEIEPGHICKNAATEKSYIGSKIIRAIPMTREDWWRETIKGVVDKYDTFTEGYKVTYEDGYKSWSPKEVFERSYREITENEKELVNT